MIYSKNNLMIPLQSGFAQEYALLNPLTGSFDLMTQSEYDRLAVFRDSGRIDPEFREFYEYLLERGYLFSDKNNEEAKIWQEFAKFQLEIENSQVQLLLIPSYGCNLVCVYCYEHGMTENGQIISKETVDAFFEYASKNFNDKKVKPFITLFGGEPLINSPVHREMIRYIVECCAKEGYELSAVTNGYDLADYCDLLAGAAIKEIQVTLDGSREVHDERRGTANGKGSFDRIVRGIEEAVRRRFSINLRTVVDYENLSDLVKLAEFVDAKGWLDLGPELFKTQIGRNYELFSCYAKPEHLMSQIELWAEFVKLSRDYPILKKFHRPDFKGIRYLVDKGSMYLASFDTCPATKTEWVFDFQGDIYPCTASCGREEFKLGTYYPEVGLYRERISAWQDRNVLTIPECRDCQYNIICGGGCGVVAANKNGKVQSPDCRPIQQLLELGIDYYRDEIHKMAGPDVVYNAGCLICGKDLVYLEESTEAECVLCGHKEKTAVLCTTGHYVCDRCHRGDILIQVERICNETQLTDVVELARQIFELPDLKMHGPEYHSVVPAIIVTAYGNNTGYKNIADIKKALEQGKAVPGGFCGSHGSCGAAVGLGIAYSIIHEVTPLSKETRGEAAKMTAAALTAISRYGGPRCCKREAVTVLETAQRLLPGLEPEAVSVYQCKQFKDNKDCINALCPYFPKPVHEEEETQGCRCRL